MVKNRFFLRAMSCRMRAGLGSYLPRNKPCFVVWFLRLLLDTRRWGTMSCSLHILIEKISLLHFSITVLAALRQSRMPPSRLTPRPPACRVSYRSEATTQDEIKKFVLQRMKDAGRNIFPDITLMRRRDWCGAWFTAGITVSYSVDVFFFY